MEHSEQIRAMQSEVQRALGAPAGSFAERWAALHDQALEIGRFAALADEPFTDQLASFPTRVADIGGAMQVMAHQGLEDIDAVLQPGLAALRTISARGQEPTAPALALWREFHAARQALLSLCPQ